MVKMESALYVGSVRHRRFRPVRHEFTYPIFMSFLDIDRIPELMSVSRLMSYNRFNVASFYEKDHFGDPALPLRQRLEADARAQGVSLPDGQIFLLTHLRYLGYVFNPVSFFYCFNRSEELSTVLAAVNNTFAETHNYWLNASCEVSRRNGRSYAFAKKFHVSPFIGMDCDYRFTFTDPADELVVQTNVGTDEGALFDSSLRMTRRPWTETGIRRVLAQYPLMTARVIAGIHWQALRLALRRVPVFRHPGPGKFRPVNSRSIGAAWKAN